MFRNDIEPTRYVLPIGIILGATYLILKGGLKATLMQKFHIPICPE